MNDPKKSKIEDHDLTPNSFEKLEKLEEVSQAEVLTAMEKMIEAAVKRRAREHKKALGDNATQEHFEEMAKVDIDEYTDDIEYGFMYASERPPDSARSITSRLQNAKSYLHSGHMTPIEGVQSAVEHWSGGAKKQFASYFLNPLVSYTISNQQILLDELITAMAAYEGIVTESRRDAKKIADDATTILDTDDKDLDKLDFSLKTAAVAVGIVGAAASIPTTGPVGLAAVCGLLGAGISATDYAKNTAGGDSPVSLDILNTVIVALEDLRYAMDMQESAISDRLAETRQNIKAMLNDESDPLNMATIIANEPHDDKNDLPNLSDGKKPSEEEFRPRDDD